MSKARNVLNPLAAVAAIVAASLVSGCGTDEDGSRTQITKNATKTTPPPVATAPVTPAGGAPETAAPPREVTYEEAEAAYQARRYDEARDLFARYAERKPGNPWGHYVLGLSAWKSADLETAETAFKQALALDTTHVKSYLNLTRVLLEAGRPGEASTTIDNAIVIDDSSAVAWRLKGRVCHDLGRIDEAVAAYRRAIQLDPADAWAMNNLAFIWIQQGRFEDALPPLARAVELRGDVAVFRNNLGMALEHTGHMQAAEEAYAAAIAADPANEKAAANGERLAAVMKTPDAAPVDLAALARAFETEIESWNGIDSSAGIVQTPPGARADVMKARVSGQGGE